MRKKEIKRFVDLFFSLTALFFFSFFWVLILFTLLFHNKGKLFYIQKRIGRGGEEFKVIKLLTLIEEKPISFFSRFLRITALDEFPQLVNILKGDMSFVGPRALVGEELTKGKLIRQRSRVRPGLTGPAQIIISKRAEITDKLRVDLWYINNWRLSLDIKIILFSVVATLTGSWEDNFSRLQFLEKIRMSMVKGYEKEE